MPACMYMHNENAWRPQGPEQDISPLQVELQASVSYHIGAWNQIYTLCKINTSGPDPSTFSPVGHVLTPPLCT